ncbi:MAG: glycosyltransferase [Saprospiraceae bacterium]
MFQAIQVIWLACLVIISLYHLYIFWHAQPAKSSKSVAPLQGVSIIIASKNDSSLLQKHLDQIIHQDYPDFEIVIADDHSELAERKKLDELKQIWPDLKIVQSPLVGKKYALHIAIHSAKNELLLVTDADCIPASKEWIKKMVLHKMDGDIVLGYSPYFKRSGWLNAMIRFETVMTGIQYLSWAIKGRPYMSVGRNTLYSRALFMTLDPLRHHLNIPYGDDDLGLQSMANSTRVNICADTNAHVFSIPASSWTEWITQKHRHLSAGHYYKTSLWWQPALYGIALVVHWLLFPLLIIFLKWQLWLLPFALGLFIRWVNYFYWTKKLGDMDTVVKFPLLEIAYAAYLAILGCITAVSKKKTWN